jgi:hypothetical protein
MREKGTDFPVAVSEVFRTLAGVLRALRTDYEAGRLQAFAERVRSDLFSDFLEMAEHSFRTRG